MAEFLVKIGTPSGEVREDVFHAPSVESLKRDLADKELHVFRIRSRSTLRAAIPRIGRRRRIKEEPFLIFNQELVTLIRAGLPLLHCLDILLERMEEGSLRTALTNVRKRVRAGESLSEAFAAQGDLFPPIYSSSLTAGERSGELDTVLERYVDYVKKLRSIRSRVKQALVYPAFLLVMSVAVVGVLIFFAIPKFVGMYQDFGAELPLMTRMIVALSGFLITNIWWLSGLVLALVIGGRIFLHSERGRHMWDRWKLHLPVLGGVLRKYSVSEMSRTLSILLRGGIPLVTALDVTSGAVGNTMIRRHLRRVAGEVREGKALWESLDRAGFMTDLALEMIKVGESTGALDQMLYRVSEFHDEQVDHRIGYLMTLFEPVMLAVMGGIVVVLLLSMYLPIFNTINAIQA